MSKFCVYCGNPVKPNDKFCIACGKPLLTNSSKGKGTQEKESQSQIESKEQEIAEKNKSKEQDIEETISEEDKEEEIEEEEGEEKNIETTDIKEALPLPDDVKHQIDLYIRSTEIDFQKKTLNEKLNEVLIATKSPQYEMDFTFKQNTNAKLEAIKTLIADLKQEESEIKSEMEEVFIIKRLTTNIETKTFQLKNLTREYRLKKMNKATFEKLKEKYKSEKNSAEAERTELLLGIKLWIQELKTDKQELIG
ncbi:MAG: zinc ribbon domain-containing protein, partial [Promethearchaeota archaeon]